MQNGIGGDSEVLGRDWAKPGHAGSGVAYSEPREPIALVGMGCRLPGGIDSPAALWKALVEGQSGVSEVPAERWDAAALWAADARTPGKTNTRWGGFLADVSGFDAGFFGIAPREAVQMDPQQRIALETTWEALEDGGILPDTLAGSCAGVFFGAWTQDYGGLAAGRYDAIDQHSAIGWNNAAIPARIAYRLGLRGPVMTVNTAHSSSLVAVHLAMQSLRCGESDSAIVGGVNLMLTPDVTIQMTKFGGMSPTGQCRAFDAGANGYVRSEGCVVVVLRRLSDAIRAGHRIYAVLLGSAVNSDGASQGLTAPNPEAQKEVLRAAWRAAGTPPSAVMYVECHGSGTSVGDPIEAQALCSVFNEGRRGPLVVGSIKTNLGHLEAAAGIAGLAKTALCLHHGYLPRNLNFEVPSPAVPFGEGGIEVLTRGRCWADVPFRYAGVSSFGYGGTNAHVALGEGPGRGSLMVPIAAPDAAEFAQRVEALLAQRMASRSRIPLLISGREPDALCGQARRWMEWLEDCADADWLAVLTTAAVHRTHFERRAALFVRDATEAKATLGALAEDRPHPDVTTGECRDLGGTVFLVPGQGSQWQGMGRVLWEESCAFRKAIAQCDAALQPITGWSVESVLRDVGGDAPPLASVDVLQPALFAMSIGLAALWRSLDVEPAAVVGTSQGEIAAAVIAGAISIEDGARVVGFRSHLLRRVTGSGGMAVVDRSLEQVVRELQGRSGLSVAVAYPGCSTVVSGNQDAIANFIEDMSSRGAFCRRVDVDYASHSAHMDPVLGELRAQLAGIRPRPCRVPMISTLTGRLVSGEELDADYWCRNLREPVRLDAVIDLLVAQKQNVWIELSAHPVLAMPLHEACAASGGVLVGTLRRDAGGLATVYRALGKLHASGLAIDWARIMGGHPAGLAALPTYAFQRQRYWLDVAEPLRAPTGVEELGRSTRAPVETPAPRDDGQSWRESLLRLPLHERIGALASRMWEDIKALLGIPPSRTVPGRQPLRELGMDSLTATELRNRLRCLRVNVSIAQVFESGVLDLAEKLAADMEQATVGDRPSPQIAFDLPPDPHAPMPLTPIQQAYWVGRQAEVEGSTAFHFYHESEGRALDWARLESAWLAVVARHDALRIAFTADGQQRVLPDVPRYQLRIEDLSAVTDAERERRLARTRSELSVARRSLEVWPLFEFQIFLLPEGRARFCLNFDLQCLDGASIQIVLEDWRRLYEDPRAQLTLLMPRAFETIVRAEAASRATVAYAHALEYWKQRCPTFDPTPQLPLAVAPSRLKRRRNVRYQGRLEASDWSRFVDSAQQRGITATMALCGAFAEVLSAWCGEAPFLLNLTHFSRPPIHPSVRHVAGDFTNLLFLECDIAAGTAFEVLAASLQRRLHAHLEHDLASGVEVLRAWRRSGREVAAPVVFTSLLGLPTSGPDASLLVAQPRSRIGTSGWLGETVFAVTQTPQVWLDHILGEADRGLNYSWDVVEGLFPDGMIASMFEAYAARVTRLARDPAAWSAANSDHRPDSHRALVNEVNDTVRPEADATLHELFAARAAAAPERPAVITPDRTLTYGELDALARHVGHRLRESGAAANTVVAVIMDKGWEQVVGVLGTLYAGAAYVPIDASLPSARRKLLVERSGARWALTQPWVDRHDLDELDEVVVIDETLATEADDGAPVAFVQTATDLAYIIYTSGSTGEPKGAMLDHRGPVNTILDMTRRFEMSESDRVFGLSSLSFDLSVFDIFGPLSVGGAVVLPSSVGRTEPERWLELLESVTVWNSVPALMQLLVEHAAGRPDVVARLQRLRVVLLSGDWIPVSLPDAIRSLVPHARVVSLGGATECSIWSIIYPVGEVRPQWTSIPYGRPMINQTFHVLTPSMTPCPSWVPGELYIGGIGLALGYRGDEEKTRERFVVHPGTGERLYRTGDWGRWLPTGDIEFLGRRDQQVKVNGYRVELGEIESVLERHPDVQQAIVVPVGECEKRLVAHVVLDTLDEDEAVEAIVSRSTWREQAWAALVTDPRERLSLLARAPGGTETEELDEVSCVLARAAVALSSIQGSSFPEPCALSTLAHILEAMRRIPNDVSPVPKALYASAGSTYPVQVLVAVRTEGVTDVPGGIYYYHPVEHALVPAGDGGAIGPGALAGDGPSAFAIFLVGRLSAIAPLYARMSEAFCAIEAGEMGRLLEAAARDFDLHLGRRLDAFGEKSRRALGLEAGDVILDVLVAKRGADASSFARVAAELAHAAPPPCHAVDGAGFARLRGAARTQFKLKQPGLRSMGDASIALPKGVGVSEAEHRWVMRRSFRAFSPGRVSVEALCAWLATAQETPPSLGARVVWARLAPLRLYVSVRDGAIEGLEAGSYRYEPSSRTLIRTGAPVALENRRVPAQNRTMMDHAAFFVFMVARMDRIAPLYGARVEHLCWLEVGRICQAIEEGAQASGLGVCQVGLDFNGLETLCGLGSGEVHLHTLVGGAVDWSGAHRGWASLGEGQGTPFDRVDADALRVHCEASLPSYMVPMCIQIRSSLPLSANGKVDRGSLAKDGIPVARPGSPAPGLARVAEDRRSTPELTAIVSRIAAEVFQVPEVPADRLFVDLGADSLLALRFRDRLGRALGRSLPAALVYDHPSVAAVVAALAQREPSSMPNTAVDATEPIAIIGMSCRAPGSITDIDQYWRLFREGREAIGPLSDRWNVDVLYDPDPDAKGKTYVREGGLLSNPDRFDASFFGITPREAVAMDPQQRILLEAVWDALELAGLPPETLNGTAAGVYVGAMGSDYGKAAGADLLDALDGYVATGQAGSVVSGRVSYVLGLHGPAMTVDTACSSSLVALHLACASLRNGECVTAIAAGVHVMSTPATYVEFSRLRALAPDGRCKSFSADADGTSWSEGCGVLILKRLSDARRDGNRILALVRGCAVNQDGRSQGLTAPNGPSQQRVIRSALAASGLTPDDIDAIEGHGTGTRLGDPIEAGALADVFGATRRGEGVHLGSSKSNLGHAQAAAGILGIIKMVLALHHEYLPRTLHAERPSEHVRWEGSGLSLLTANVPWPRSGGRTRRAGVSSFGISGTNAHAIIEEAPPATPCAEVREVAAPLLVSARDMAALREQCGRWARWLDAHPEVAWAEVLSTAALRRTHFEWRAAVHAVGASAARRPLHAVAAGTDVPEVTTGRACGAVLAMVFPGSAGAALGVAAGVYRRRGFDTFTVAFDQAAAACEEHLGTPGALRGVLLAATDSAAGVAARKDHGLAALFALEVALFRHWEALGVKAGLVLGQAAGEIACAHAAGVLSLADAARLVCARARYEEDRNIERLRRAVDRLTYHSPEVTVVSGRSGRVIDTAAGEWVTADDWLRSATDEGESRVEQGIRAVAEAGATMLLHCGPGSLDAKVASYVSDRPNLVAVESFRSERTESASLSEALGVLHVHGQRIDWGRVFQGNVGPVVDLPTYAFQRQRFWWPAPEPRNDTASLGLSPIAHPVLVAATSLAGTGTDLLIGRISPEGEAWTRDGRHEAGPDVLGTEWLDIAFAACSALGCPTLEELTLEDAAHRPAAPGTQIQVSVEPADAAGRRSLSIHARREARAEWVRIASGVLSSRGVGDEVTAETWPPPGAAPLSIDSLDASSSRAVPQGQSPRVPDRAWRQDESIYAEVRLPSGRPGSATAHAIHPRLLQAAVQLVAAFEDPSRVAQEAFDLCIDSLARVKLHAPGADGLRVRLQPSSPRKKSGRAALVAYSLSIRDVQNRPVATVGEIVLRMATTGSRVASAAAPRIELCRVGWKTTRPVHAGFGTQKDTVVVGANGRLAGLLGAEHLSELSTIQASVRAGRPAPKRVVLDWSTLRESVAGSDLPELVLGETARALADLQALLSDPHLADVVVVGMTASTTRVASSAAGGGLTHAACWGLVRSALREHPHRKLRLVDVEGFEFEGAVVSAVLADDEPELVSQAGKLLVPRLELVDGGDWRGESPARPLGPDGTVLITGGLGELGGALAQHLVKRHGVRHLVLISRRGLHAAGARELVAELMMAGARTVAVESIDIAERTQIGNVLDAIQRERRLLGVFHLAGVLDDCLLSSLSRERLARVLRPKVEGAWNLHEQTKSLGLVAFVLFSSLAGITGAPGQANYAAANAFLDALASHRRSQGLAALSLAWGLWEPRGFGMTRALKASELARIRRDGMLPLSIADGMALLDASLARPESTLLPMALDARERERGEGAPGFPALFRHLGEHRPVKPEGATAPATRLRLSLSELPTDDRLPAMTMLVQEVIAAVMGLGAPGAVPPRQPLSQLGLDSLMAVHVRNHLSVRCGASLPATLAFDYPTPAAIAELLLARCDLADRPRFIEQDAR